MTNLSLRVGRIPYANLAPIFHALTTHFSLEGVRFVAGTPSELNRKLRAGRLDISPSSSIEYGKHPDRYLLCPDISISSRSKVMSVLLLSNGPGDPDALENLIQTVRAAGYRFSSRK